MKKVNTQPFSFKPDYGLAIRRRTEVPSTLQTTCSLLARLSAAPENGRHQFLLQLMHLPALGWRRVIEPCQMEQTM